MDPMTGGLLGGLFSGVMNMFGQNQTNQANSANTAATNQTNIELQQNAQNFEQQMSSTAYQRASSDMKAAGLNPMMMFGSGGPASTPNVQPARVNAPQYNSPVSAAADSAQKAVSSAVQLKQFDMMTDEIANLKATNDKIVAETATEQMRPGLIGAQTGLTNVQRIAAQHQLPGLLVSAKTGQTISDFQDAHPWLNKLLSVGDWAGHKIGGALSALQSGAQSAGALGWKPFW